MILGMFSIRDAKAESYGPPFSAQNNALAIRYIQELMDNQATPFKKYPEDFSIWRHANFNTDTCKTTEEEPTFIVNIMDILGA